MTAFSDIRKLFTGRRLIVAALIVLGLVLLATGSSDQGDESSSSASTFAAELQRASSLEYFTLEDEGYTLTDVAQKADVVGTGEIVDVRAGYELILEGDTSEEDEGVSHVLVVIKPEELQKGASLLGDSGLVFLDQVAPGYDVQAGDDGLDELRAAAESTGRVAFMFTLKASPVKGTTRTDELQGREADDPLLEPTHPTGFLALDESAAVAYPLLVGESIAETPGNLDALKRLDAKIDRFSVPTAGSVGTNSP